MPHRRATDLRPKIRRAAIKFGLGFHLADVAKEKIPGLTWEIMVNDDGSTATVTISCPPEHVSDPQNLIERVQAELQKAEYAPGQEPPSNIVVKIGS